MPDCLPLPPPVLYLHLQPFPGSGARRYWRSTTIIPMLLAVDTLYVSLYDSQERYFDLLEARILLLLVVILMMAAIRRGQSEVYDEIRTYEEKYQLQQQVVSAANYVKMSKESRSGWKPSTGKNGTILTSWLGSGPQRTGGGARPILKNWEKNSNSHQTAPVLPRIP